MKCQAENIAKKSDKFHGNKLISVLTINSSEKFRRKFVFERKKYCVKK